MPGQQLRSVSDTAFWMAQYRAIETDRPDAIIKDPLARLLAGDRGEQLVQQLTQGQGMTWPILRTVCFDELILALVEQGVQTILNLAAGLDARPYRLRLPRSLSWIEVDLPEIIFYKEEKLSGQRPACSVRRVSGQLYEPELRRALFAEVNASSSSVAVLTEGLLMYLRAEEVASLARDLHAQPRFQYWITDLAAPYIVERMKKIMGKDLQAAKADMYFAPAEGPEFFHPHGWKFQEFREFLNEGQRWKREIPMARRARLLESVFPWYIRKMRAQWRSGVVLMNR
ncbi:MAG TPA: SAM-dependent methyltransferase [Candidatus Angelobacter sp.]|jgi:methyltransferase (TIGR00027 family)